VLRCCLVLALGLLLVGCPQPATPRPAVVVRYSQLALTGSVAALDSQAVGSQASARVDLDCLDADLAEVMDELGRLVGRNILVSPNVSESVTVSLENIPWLEAVEVLAKMTRCEVDERDNGLILLTQPAEIMIQGTEDLRTVLQLVAAHRGHDIVVPESLSGSVKVRNLVVTDSTLQELLDQAGGGYRVSYDESGDAVVSASIAPSDTSGLAAPETSLGD
jgi:type II secretory pathway component HofQ